MNDFLYKKKKKTPIKKMNDYIVVSDFYCKRTFAWPVCDKVFNRSDLGSFRGGDFDIRTYIYMQDFTTWKN